MKKLLLFSLIAPLLFVYANIEEEQGNKSLHHDRYTGILYSDEGGGCIPGGGGGSGGDPTDPPIPPVPPKSYSMAGGKLGIIAFNRKKNGRKIKYHMRTKGVEGITGVHLHCRDIAGNDAGVGVTLKKTGWFDHGWEDATGYIKSPDEDNPCDWSSLDDIHKSIENGEAFIRVKTTGNPDGELSGDLQCIGFYNTDWF
ncbi:MAG: CHRD domain-containing protein [Deltaproteobacteria bacterium]|nr:MAG: CHRD domain-containing protein [Deltaproteobacteria bacterium]